MGEKPSRTGFWIFLVYLFFKHFYLLKCRVLLPFFNSFQREESQIHLFLKTFFFYVEVPHTALITLLYLSPSSSSSPDPSQTLGFGSFLKPVWFSFKNPFCSSGCKPHISKAMKQQASPTLCSLLAVAKPGNKKISLSSRITNILPQSGELGEKEGCSESEFHQVAIPELHNTDGGLQGAVQLSVKMLNSSYLPFGGFAVWFGAGPVTWTGMFSLKGNLKSNCPLGLAPL